MFLGGIQAYGGLSRLEDPEFTIKDGLVNTPYPGATAAEVEEEVSDRIEKAVQQLGQLDWIESTSYWGASQIKAHIKDEYDKFALPQVWDELRRKVGDVQGQLPPGAGPSVVNDDFGDVWGVFIAIYGDDYTRRRAARRGQALPEGAPAGRRTWPRSTSGASARRRSTSSRIGIACPSSASSPPRSCRRCSEKNLAAESGRVDVGPEFISIQPSGEIEKVEDFEACC